MRQHVKEYERVSGKEDRGKNIQLGQDAQGHPHFFFFFFFCQCATGDARPPLPFLFFLSHRTGSISGPLLRWRQGVGVSVKSLRVRVSGHGISASVAYRQSRGKVGNLLFFVLSCVHSRIIRFSCFVPVFPPLPGLESCFTFVTHRTSPRRKGHERNDAVCAAWGAWADQDHPRSCRRPAFEIWSGWRRGLPGAMRMLQQ